MKKSAVENKISQIHYFSMFQIFLQKIIFYRLNKPFNNSIAMLESKIPLNFIKKFSILKA